MATSTALAFLCAWHQRVGARAVVQRLGVPTDVARLVVHMLLAGTVASIAGTGTLGHKDGPAPEATFGQPMGVTVDAAGNIIVADEGNHLIRKISPCGKVVTTLAGTARGRADGKGELACFANPRGVTVDKAGNIFVADTQNHSIRKISPQGVVSTVAGGGCGAHGCRDGVGSTALFHLPKGLVVDGTDSIFVADFKNNMIRRVSPQGVVSTLAGAVEKGYRDGIGARSAI
eukprot:TRINITY_DN3720_c0_g1_i2.p1 TRINITY_DN3720_c0_g1~~TRINITY_DN3720_c0_g1_i2.p1  ORF type:complete len:238 (-),score=24.31 TRINITY_DN3720_c0_g1_i2:201-893(-)